MKVTIHHLYISDGHNFFGRYGKTSLDHSIIEKESIDLVAGKGIIDDRFFDYKPDYKGQITFFDHAVYEQVLNTTAKDLAKDVPPSIFRRNVIIQGIDPNTLIDQVFSLTKDDTTVKFSGSAECSPCFWMDEACAPGTEEFLKGRGGLRARILSNGSLKIGEHDLQILED